MSDNFDASLTKIEPTPLPWNSGKTAKSTNQLPENRISKVKINLYPFYIEQLILIYCNLLKQNTETTSDCFYAISEFLKPTNKDQYDTIYSVEYTR